MKRSDSEYLRKKFELMSYKGLDHKVSHDNGHGTA